MTDIRAGDEFELDEDHLPWLEAVEEEDERSGPSLLKIIVSIFIGLIILGLVISGFYWMRNRSEAPAGPQLIEAEKGDYKVKPAEPGGMKVDNAGETALAASEGDEPQGKLNMDAVPETPITRPAPAPKAAPPPAPAPKTAAVTPTPPKAAPAPFPKPEPASAGGQTIQLGAFASGAIANDSWKQLSSRFKFLEPLAHTVTVANVNGHTYYRLRATGPDAKALCGRLRVAGESCISVD
jgi:hypothetical protein